MPFDSRYKPIDFTDSNLFKPFKLNDNVVLQHRVALAPLTRFRADGQYVPNKDAMAEEYYAQRASAAGTLIITEGSFITEQLGGFSNVPGVWTGEQLKQWSKIFKRIHENESFVFVQFWSMGRQCDPSYLKSRGLRYLGPSEGVYADENARTSAIECGNELEGMSTKEIKQLIENYVESAVKVIEHGADGVEIHAAGGYLLDEFLDPRSNKRTDEYGGSIENRSRLVLEIIDAIVAKLGGGDKLAVRFSPYGTAETMLNGVTYEHLTIAQHSHIIGELEKRAQENPQNRLAYIHLVEPRNSTANWVEGSEEPLHVSNDFIFSVWKGTVVRAGNYVLDNKFALKDINANDRTILAFGRYFISNPDLVERFKNQWPLNEYNRDTFYTHGKEGYLDYPTYKE